MLVLGTFRTTAAGPVRTGSATRLAELHRFDGVRRLDLAGLDTEAIAEFVSETPARPRPRRARPRADAARPNRREPVLPAGRTGGSTWNGTAASPPCAARERVPATLGDTVAARLAGLDERVRETVDLAAVIGDRHRPADPGPGRFGGPRREHGRDRRGGRGGRASNRWSARGDRYAFVHSITRQVVLDRLPHTRCTALHARVAQTLEAHGDPGAGTPHRPRALHRAGRHRGHPADAAATARHQPRRADHRRAVADRAGVPDRGRARARRPGAAAVLRPVLDTCAGTSLVGGQFVAVFGSADRYLGQVAALLGEADAAEQHFGTALAMDRSMGSVVHTAETLAAHARWLHATDPARARELATEARALAEPIGHVRVLRRLDRLRPSAGPATSRRGRSRAARLARGMSNGRRTRLFISANTAANPSAAS